MSFVEFLEAIARCADIASQKQPVFLGLRHKVGDLNRAASIVLINEEKEAPLHKKI